MKIFYGKFYISQIGKSKLQIKAHNIICYVWIRAYNVPEARRIVTYLLKKNCFFINHAIADLFEVNEINFLDADLGLDNYKNAKENGISIFFLEEADDGKMHPVSVELKDRQDLTLEKIFSVIHNNNQKGRCLHFDADERCNSIINAHSIQKSGLLKLIQENGYVYTPFFTSKNNNQLMYKKQSINKMSTFLGFCGKHDKELFSPIDDFNLKPTLEQTALYSYRSLCKEYYIKENSIKSIKEIIDNEKQNPAINEFLSDYLHGYELGFADLKYHKKNYDEMLKEKDFQQMHYVLYESLNNPNIVFSGILYPDYDFLGKPIQNIANTNNYSKMLTFCSVPLDTGWGFLFSWMKYNDDVCLKFVESLKKSIEFGNKSEDLLFRLLLLSENHAVSPKWFKSLSEEAKEEILERMDYYINPFTDIDPMILTKGVESFSNWSFQSVSSNID